MSRELFERGDWLGDYEILGRLRAGGMATLFLGRRHNTAGVSRPVVIKVIHPHLAEDDLIVKMFIDEARISSHISHSNVVYVEKFGEQDGIYYMVMEYVDGVSLDQVLRTMQRLNEFIPPEVAVHLAIETATGLHAAHETTDEEGTPLGIVHRDVSPSNVLITRNGRVKVIDFGIAKARNRLGQTRSGASLKGKLRYMSPEQAWGKDIDRRTDVYALGVLLWELLTARPLFKGADDLAVLEMVRNPQIPSPREYNPNVPLALEKVVMRATCKDPRLRIQDAAEFRAELARAVPEAASLAGDTIGKLVTKVRETLGVSEAEDRRLTNPRRTPPNGVPRLETPLPAAAGATEIIDDVVLERSQTSVNGAVGEVSQLAPRHPRSWMIVAGSALVLAISIVVATAIATRNNAPHAAAPPPAAQSAPPAAAQPPVKAPQTTQPVTAGSAATGSAATGSAATGSAAVTETKPEPEPETKRETKPETAVRKPTTRRPSGGGGGGGNDSHTTNVDGVMLSDDPSTTKPSKKPTTKKPAAAKTVDVGGTVLSE